MKKRMRKWRRRVFASTGAVALLSAIFCTLYFTDSFRHLISWRYLNFDAGSDFIVRDAHCAEDFSVCICLDDAYFARSVPAPLPISCLEVGEIAACATWSSQCRCIDGGVKVSLLRDAHSSCENLAALLRVEEVPDALFHAHYTPRELCREWRRSSSMDDGRLALEDVDVDVLVVSGWFNSVRVDSSTIRDLIFHKLDAAIFLQDLRVERMTLRDVVSSYVQAERSHFDDVALWSSFLSSIAATDVTVGTYRQAHVSTDRLRLNGVEVGDVVSEGGRTMVQGEMIQNGSWSHNLHLYSARAYGIDPMFAVHRSRCSSYHPLWRGTGPERLRRGCRVEGLRIGPHDMSFGDQCEKLGRWFPAYDYHAACQLVRWGSCLDFGKADFFNLHFCGPQHMEPMPVLEEPIEDVQELWPYGRLWEPSPRGYPMPDELPHE